MYEGLAKSLRTTVMLYGAVGQEDLVTTQLMKQAADAIEERDRYALTIQHEMMAEAESHMAQVERLNKQIEELQKKYAEVLKAAKSMHLWIFLNTGDEQAVYDECGLTDEMNAVLGYGGQFIAEPSKEET